MYLTKAQENVLTALQGTMNEQEQEAFDHYKSIRVLAKA